MIYVAAALTVCFLIVIGLMLAAPEGHEVEGVGFSYGPEQPLDAAQDGDEPDARRVTRVAPFLHSATDSAGTQDDHAGR